MGAMRDDNFYVVQGWMINRLGLKGNELQLYAIIYGFTQAEGQKFNGSLQYLADWLGITRQNALKRLQSLVDKGLLIKDDIYTNGVKFCEYRCCFDSGGVIETATGVLSKQQRGVAETATGCCRNSNGGVAETATNNYIDIHTDIHIDKKGVPPTPPPKKTPSKSKADAEAILARYTQDTKTLELLRDWLKVRKAKRAPETEKALTLNLDKLAKLATESGLSVNEYLEAVIARGWAAFYAIQQPGQAYQRQQPARSRIRSEAEHAAGQHQSGFGW